MQPHTILRYLPENFQLAAGDERGVLRALLHVMDGMHAPVERVLKSIEQYVDPYRAPEPFVLMQAGWLGLDRYFVWSGGTPGAGEVSFPTGVERLRLLIAELPLLVRNRGTRESLIRFLEVATGVRGFAIDASPVGKTFHFRVQVPDAARALTPFIEQIVSEERPAHATYEILIPETTPPAALKSGTGRRRASRSRKRRQKE